VPRPPGTRRRSRVGAVANVCVGTRLWPRATGDIGAFVVTGSKVEDRRDNVRSWLHERTFRQSTGPKTSRAWNPGKRTTPMRRGLGFGGSSGGDVNGELADCVAGAINTPDIGFGSSELLQGSSFLAEVG
jgi:hypothetical protein